MASDEQKRSGKIDEKTTSQPEPSATAEPHAQSQKFWRTFLKKMAIAVGLFWKELYRLRLNRLDLARAERRLGEKAYATGTADGQPGLVSRLDQVTGRVAHLRQQKSDVSSTFSGKAKALARKSGKAIQLEVLQLKRRRMLRRLGAMLRQSDPNSSSPEEARHASAVADRITLIDAEITRFRTQTYPWARRPLLAACVMLALFSSGITMFKTKHSTGQVLESTQSSRSETSAAPRPTFGGSFEQNGKLAEQSNDKHRRDVLRRAEEEVQRQVAAAEQAYREQQDRERAEAEKRQREEAQERERVAAAKRALAEEKQREEERRVAAENARQEQQQREAQEQRAKTEAQRDNERQQAVAKEEERKKEQAPQLAKNETAGSQVVAQNSPSAPTTPPGATAPSAQSATSATLLLPPGTEWLEKIPHDPQLLEKLHDGRFEEIGQDKMDLIAVWRAFQHSGLNKLNDTSGLKMGPEEVQQMVRYFSDGVAVLETAGTLRIQPNYLRTAEMIQQTGGVDAEWAQTTCKNLFRLILQRASGRMPATAENEWPLMRRSVLNVLDSEILQNTQTLPANERAAVEQQIKDLAQKGAQVILAEYSDPSEKSSYHRQRLLFWYRDVPVLRRDLLAISNSHPLAELGNLAVTEVPPVLGEAKRKHAESMAAEGKQVEVTPDIDNPDYVGWKGLAPGASATYARNSWIQSGQSKQPTQNGTELRILQSVSDANAVVKINEQLDGRIKEKTHTFEAKIPDQRDPDERQAPVQEEVELNSRKFSCSRRSHVWKGLEEKATTTIWTSDEVPGGLVRRLVDSEDTHAVHRLSDTTLQSYIGGRNGDWSGKPEGRPLFKTILSFTRQSGIRPAGRLVEGDDGSFYGTTWDGPMTKDGHWGAGTVFRLSPDGALTTLHTFHNKDGAHPAWGLTKGRDGNLYGTTRENGLAQKGAAHTTGFGTAFNITPSGQFTTLHYFGEPPDGKKPAGELLLASDGNLYGTTPGGGAVGCGTVFRITPSDAFSIVHSFSVSPEEGCGPQGRLVEGPDSSLYGVTRFGGRTARQGQPGHGGSDSGKGTIFKMTFAGKVTTLYHFGEDESDGKHPQGGLTKGSDGSLYGTTSEGGGYSVIGVGTIFKFTPPADYSVVFSFQVATDDGYGPSGPLTLGGDGNLYGTTTNGGNIRDRGEPPGNGTVFRFSSAGALTTLHTFRREDVRHRNFGIGEGRNTAKAEWAEHELAAGREHPEITDGKSPVAGLIEGKDGMLYGTTPAGGIWEYGTFFRVDPKAFKDQ